MKNIKKSQIIVTPLSPTSDTPDTTHMDFIKDEVKILGNSYETHVDFGMGSSRTATLAIASADYPICDVASIPNPEPLYSNFIFSTLTTSRLFSKLSHIIKWSLYNA